MNWYKRKVFSYTTYWNLHSIKSENWSLYHFIIYIHIIRTREQIVLKKKYIILFAYQIESRCVANIELEIVEKSGD